MTDIEEIASCNFKLKKFCHALNFLFSFGYSQTPVRAVFVSSEFRDGQFHLFGIKIHDFKDRESNILQSIFIACPEKLP